MITVIWFVLSAVLVAADQITKYLAASLKGGDEIVLIKGVLSLNYVENPGAAWGFLKNASWVIIVITAIAIIILPFLMIKFRKLPKLFGLSLAVIWAGAIGNFIGHVFSGYVIDFIQVRFIDFPSFNVADCCITVGAILLCVYIIFFDKYFFRDGKKKDTSDEDNSGDGDEKE